MPKRGDNIRKRKDGRWEGRYKKSRSSDGRIVYGSVYGKTYKEAKEKLASAAKYPLQPAASKRQEKTFGEVLNLWMDNNRARLKGGTINKYQSLIETHIMPELGEIKITELSSTKVNTFLESKMSKGRINGSGGLSPSYVRSIMLVVNAAIKYAVSEQLCVPLKTPICKPPAGKPELSVLTAVEQKKLETALLDQFDPTCAGIYLSLHTGLRIGEVCSLAWDDIDLNAGVIHVRHTVARVRCNDPAGSTTLIIDTPKTKASKRDMTMAQIRITPEELRGAADFLEQKLEAINSEVTALKGKVDEVTANWEGSAQSSFIDTFNSNMYPVLKDTLPQVITGIAGQLDGAANAIEQADEEVAKAFKG